MGTDSRFRTVESSGPASSPGELRRDRPVPSESQLQQEFGVARGTARKAIQVLRDHGLVITVHGRGSYVHPAR